MTTQNPCNPIEQQLRADYIEALYQTSGRTDGLYTNLFQDRIKTLISRDVYYLCENINDATPSSVSL